MTFDLPRRYALGLCCVLLGACSGAQSLETAQGPCIEGQSESCRCDDGSIAVRTCQSDSEYGACQCGAQGTGGVQSVDPTAGAGMSAGVGFAGDTGTNPVAGMGGSAGGIAGSSGTAGGAGMPGGSGGMSAGTSGMAGIGMEPDAGTAVDAGSSGPGRDPDPGEVYGECLDDGSCDAGLFCISDASSGIPMSYCSATCDALSGMRCPKPREGMATCVIGICVR